MELLRVLRDRLRALVNRDGVSSEIRDELQFHVDMRAADLERRGMTRADAQREARRRVGNVAALRDRGYDIRGGGVMETILQDVRYALRLLRRQRGYTLVALATLALGIGATTAIFSVADAALFRPLPHPHPEQLVRVSLTRIGGPPNRRLSPSVNDMRQWRTLKQVFATVAAWKDDSGIIIDREPERVSIQRITSDYLTVFGHVPALGRAFGEIDEAPSAPQVAMIGFNYWKSHYNSDPGVVGQNIKLVDEKLTIVGVMPAAVDPRTKIFRPMQITEDAANARQYPVYARLRDGITHEQAQRELDAQMARLQDDPRFKGYGAAFSGIVEGSRNAYRPTVRILLGAVACVLLIACVNVASLQLTRGATRQQEIAVRASLGAGRLRVMRQLLVESLVLASLGASLGLFFAWIGLDTLVANIPLFLSSDMRPAIDWRILSFTLGLALLTSGLFGLLPAWRLTRSGVHDALARTPRGQRGVLSRRLGHSLVAFEVACAVVLLAGAGLMLKSFSRLLNADIGFDPAPIVTMEVTPVQPDPDTYDRFYSALVDRIRLFPVITSVGAVDDLPLSGSFSFTMVTIEGASPPNDRVGLGRRTVLPGYLEALNLPVLDGRTVQAKDLTGEPVVVASESAARAMFGDAPAVGRRVVYNKVTHAIVGVVGDLRHGGGGEEFQKEMYFPARPAAAVDQTIAGRPSPREMIVVARTSRPDSTLSARLKQAAVEIGVPVILRRVRTGDDWLDANVTTPRQRTVLLALLGGLGALLAIVGIFGVTSFVVARRTHEIGVRMAFGARPGDVVRSMMRDAAAPIVAGVVAGTGAAWWATKIISAFLFDTTPHDPATFALAAAGLIAAGLVAAWIPARRSARVDPLVALRAD
ncbi:MAG TPA: ABC transporter permease [Vicinamibacterales bacterium]|nr:ABC transporter permease [Vicinamibacterales bacterium]